MFREGSRSEQSGQGSRDPDPYKLLSDPEH